MTVTIGFLSVRKHADHGYFGGYLVLNRLARPLEFHCTLPVKPSRAQALLYGPTIDDFVCGEQIGKALVAKAKLKPDLLICDSSAALAVTLVSDVVAVQLDWRQVDSPASDRLELPKSHSASLKPLSARAQKFSVLSDSAITEPQLHSILEKLSANFDLTEQFQRVVEALLEAHPIAKAA